MKRKNKSFSLVELMVVIAIVGILSSIAIPSYRDYVNRGKIAEGISLARGWQIKIATYYNINGGWPPQTGEFVDVNDVSESVSRLRWSPPKQAIEIWFRNLSGINDGKLLSFYPMIQNGNIIWNCGSNVDPFYQLPCKVLPSNCQTNCTQ